MSNMFVSADKFRELAQGEHISDDLGLRKQFIAEVKVENDDRRELLFTISSDSVDRDGDKIAVDGWQLDAYRKNPVVLWAHDYRNLPIARSEKVWIEAGKLKSLARFVPQDISDFADRVYRLYKAGFLSATSVGFRPVKWAWTEDKDRKLGIDFEQQELLEYSAVPVPANPDALIEARAAGIDIEPLKTWARGIFDARNIKSLREFEDFLRDAGGFSRKDATWLASHGWQVVQREADTDYGPVVSTLQRFRASLLK